MNRLNKHKFTLVFMLIILMLFNSIPIYADISVDSGIDAVTSATVNYENEVDINGENFNGKARIDSDIFQLEGRSEYKGARIKLTIRDKNNKLKFLDQAKTDQNGRIKFKTKLKTNEEYKANLKVLKEDINFIFNTNIKEEIRGDVSFRVEGKNKTILKETDIEVTYGKDTILDTLIKLLDEFKIDYKLSNNLIDEIAGEQDFQWMVNNKGGMYGPEYKLQEGDEVVLIDGEIVDPVITEVLIEDDLIRLVNKETKLGISSKTILIGENSYKLDSNGSLKISELNLESGKYEVKFGGEDNLIRSTSKNLFIEKQSKKNKVTLSVEKFTLGQGYIVEPIELEVQEGLSVAEILTGYLDELNIEYKNTGSVEDSFYLSRIYDEASMENLNIPQYILDKTGDVLKKEDPWLGEFDFYNTSGWMYSLNNEFPRFGMSQGFPEDGDVIRVQFTIYGLGADLGGSFMSTENIVKVANKDSLTNLVGQVNNDNKKAEYLEDKSFSNLYKKAYENLTSLESSQETTDELEKKLQAKYDEFSNGKKTIDKSKLRLEVKKLKNLEFYKYTHETRNPLKNALVDAEIILSDEEATQVEIDKKVEEILKLYGDLEEYDSYITLSVDKENIREIAGVDVEDPIKPTKVGFNKGETAWDVLKRELEDRSIEVDYNYTPQYDSVYVEWIDGDGEFDHGEGSGWMFNVNGWYPNFGVSKYILENGDVMQWRYTTNYGVDLGSDVTDWPDREDIPRLIEEINKLDMSSYSDEELKIKETLFENAKEVYKNERTPQADLNEILDNLKILKKKIQNKDPLN